MPPKSKVPKVAVKEYDSEKEDSVMLVEKSVKLHSKRVNKATGQQSPRQA